jgi:hypothetical protein
MYDGHLPDGSSVQKHSAGGLYPYVLMARETPTGLMWGFMTPKGAEILVGTQDKAHEAAVLHETRCEANRKLCRKPETSTESGLLLG